MTDTDRIDMIRSGIYGVCVGDALGVPVEFRSRESLKREPISEMSDGGTYGQPEGTWSDDGSLTLCLAQSIGETGGVHTHDIMERFLDWYENGKYSPWGERFDCGITTAQALFRYKEGVEPVLCGGNKVSSNGNGSLMRILPAAYYLYSRFGADLTKSRKAMDIVHKASALTHRHAIALSACGIYANIAVRLMEGVDRETAVRDGAGAARGWYRRHEKFAEALPIWERIRDTDSLAELPETEIKSGGYVADTLTAALWCFLTTGSYRDCVLTAVNLGEDTDTTAAVAGGLAGLAYGYGDIPKSWLAALKGKPVIEEACTSLLQGMEGTAPENGACGVNTEKEAQAAYMLRENLKEAKADRTREKIIVMGGSFHPPTIAHFKLLQAAADAVGADKGIFAPASGKYIERKLKRSEPSCKLMTDELRIQMLEAVCREDPRFSVETGEMGEDAGNHAYDTLCRVQKKYPNARIFYLAGCDKLQIMPRWRHIRELLEYFQVLTAARSGQKPETVIARSRFLYENCAGFLSFQMPDGTEGISSSRMRRYLRDHDEQARDMVTEEVWEILVEKGYADPNCISRFTGRYAFLGNFYDAPVEFGGIQYRNSEAAFQAQKCEDEKKRLWFAGLAPGRAKSLGGRVRLREDWEEVKTGLMLEIVRAKFTQNPELAEKLLATGEKRLVEGTAWNDTCWGIDIHTGKGENRLGKILMQVRDELKENQYFSS